MERENRIAGLRGLPAFSLLTHPAPCSRAPARNNIQLLRTSEKLRVPLRFTANSQLITLTPLIILDFFETPP